MLQLTQTLQKSTNYVVEHDSVLTEKLSQVSDLLQANH